MTGARRLGSAIAITAAALAVQAGTATGALGQAAEPVRPAEQMRVPESPDEHFARAASYAAKAGAYRQEAAAHRRMFADYESSGSNSAIQSKMGRELPWVAKMRNHCDSYVKEAERLAAEADRFAEFHRMRGAEMQGK